MIYKAKDLDIKLLENYVKYKDVYKKISDWENKENVAFLELGENYYDKENKNYGILNSGWLLVFDWVETQGYCEFKHVKDSSDMMYYEEGCTLYKLIPFVDKKKARENYNDEEFDKDAIDKLTELGYELNKDYVPVIKTHSFNDGSAFLKYAKETMDDILNMPDNKKLKYGNDAKYAVSSVGGFDIMYEFSSLTSKKLEHEKYELKVFFERDNIFVSFILSKDEFIKMKKFFEKMDKDYLAAYNKRIDRWNNTVTEYIVSDDDITEYKDYKKYLEDPKTFSVEYRKRLKDFVKKNEKGLCKIIKIKGSEYHEMHGWYFYNEKIQPEIWSENKLEKMAGEIEHILDDYPSFKVYSLWLKTKGMCVEERLKYLKENSKD